MKKSTATLLAAVLLTASSVLTPAAAQDAASLFIAGQSADEYLAKDQLIGAKVHGPDGKIIGDVEDLIINESNQVIGVVMGTGGFLGLAEKKVGVGLRSLKFDEVDGKTVVTMADATKAAIDAAPAFTRVRPKKTLLERAREKAQELTDKTSASTEDLVEKAKPAIEDAKEKAVEAYEKAKEAAQPALDKAKEATEEATKAVNEAVEAAKEATEKAIAPAPVEPPPAPAASEPAPAAAAAPAAPAPAATEPPPAATEPAPAAPAQPQ